MNDYIAEADRLEKTTMNFYYRCLECPSKIPQILDSIGGRVITADTRAGRHGMPSAVNPNRDIIDTIARHYCSDEWVYMINEKLSGECSVHIIKCQKPLSS
jgi:hypothetical protein